jgi:hypothetical protein
MNHQFKIESIFKLKTRNKICIFAQLMGDNDFKLSEKAMLGNVEIENWLDIPGEPDEDGNPRTDLFAFLLKENNDKNKLKPGDIVELIS